MKTILFIAILITQNYLFSQTTWYEIPTGTTKQLNTIHFPSELVGYIGGNDSLILKTIDGGQTWSELNFSGITFYPGEENIINLQFTSNAIGYCMVGPYSGIYKTIDAGLTWNAVTPVGNLCFNEGLFFFDEQNGFFGGSGCFQGELIEKMSSGVLTTTTMNESGLSSGDRINDIDFYNAGFGIASSAGGRFFLTTDGGTTWDSIPSSLASGIPITSVDIINDTLVFAGYDNLGSGFGMLRSDDGGSTWFEDLNSATFYYPAFYCVHHGLNDNVYAGAEPSFGTGGLIFESTDYLNWSFYEVDQPIYEMTSSNDSTVFAVGDSGYVVVNQPSNVLSNLKYTQSDYEVVVYPNPSSDIIYLTKTSAAYLYQVSIYSTNGNLVLNTNSNGELNISGLESGVYIIELSDGLEIKRGRIIKK